MVEKCYIKIFNNKNTSNLIGSESPAKKVSDIPILPNLVTSTDETTIFATPSKIFDKEKVYLVARPTKIKNKKMDSGKCNDYSTKELGDSHCRGLQILLNRTFTAGGLAAPIFVVIYGLTPNEMPKNDIVVLLVLGRAITFALHTTLV